MENKSILLSKRSQSKKAKYCMFPTIYYSGKGKTMQLKKSVVARGYEGGKDEYTGYRGFLGQQNHSVSQYNNEYVSKTFANAQHVKHQE